MKKLLKVRTFQIFIIISNIILILALFYSHTFAAPQKEGIDVSEHNGSIDWGKVKSSGVDFAIIRCGHGDNYDSRDDKQYERNISGCIANKIPYAIYFYSYAVNSTGSESIQSEISHAKRLLRGKKPFCVYYDVEESRALSLGKTTLTNHVIQFCDSIKSAGYKVGVYANTNWFTNHLNSYAFKSRGYSIWVADYHSSCGFKSTSYDTWQYTSKGSCAGINGNVDKNKIYNNEIINGSKLIIPCVGDFDGDGKSDLSLKTDDGHWFINYASNGFGPWDVNVTNYGGIDAKPSVGDFDGDGKSDISVKTDDGHWLIDYAKNNFGFWDVNLASYGGTEAQSAVGDFDGDKKFDLSVRTDDGRWLIDYSKNNYSG
jgi:GH25 family lysozyme M1 (1,4-beta-N-acetylmuramidase)